MKGRHHLLKLTPEDVSRARSYLEEAIALDPSYAPAYARLAHALQVSAFMGWQAPRDATPLAKAAASRALALDEDDPDAHCVLAMVAGQFEDDWAEALRHCHLALACEDVPPDVAGALASFILLPLGRVDEALSVLERACAGRPALSVPATASGRRAFGTGLYTEAIDQLQRVIGLHEDFWPAHFFLGGHLRGDWHDPKAIAILEKGTRAGALLLGHYGLACRMPCAFGRSRTRGQRSGDPHR